MNVARGLIARAAFLALAMGVIRCAAPSMGSSAPAMCGPFGNPPAITMGVVKPDCLHGKLLGPWKDAYDGDRYACLWEPYPAAPQRRLPLVIYLHPSLFGPKTVAKTGLLLYQDSASLSAGQRVGYIVLAPLARKTLHHYPRPDDKGLGWDNWYRQLNPDGDVTVGNRRYLQNVDATTIDHFVAQVVLTGKVDPARIHIMGWSNGAAMAYLYALNRPTIAAAAVYSAPDPFGAFNDPCPQTPVKGPPANVSQIQIFNPGVPTMHLHNSCDIAGICPNGERMARHLEAAGVPVHDTIVDFLGNQVTQCTLSCGTSESGNTTPSSDPLGYSVGFMEHARWPKKWTPAMLDYLRAHPLDAGK
jgi:predicted esterase